MKGQGMLHRIGIARVAQWLLALVALVSFGTSVPSAARAAVSGAPVEVPVITSLTGYLAFIGKEQERALRLLENAVNDDGGIGGRPVKFLVSDDETSVQTAVQLASQVIAVGKSPVLLGPLATAACDAIYATLKNGPVLYCFAPAFEPSRNTNGFTMGVTSNDFAVAMLRYARLRGFKRVANFSTFDVAGQANDKSLTAALSLPENRDVQIVANEHFGVADISVAGQLAKIRAANPQIVIVWTTGTPLGTALRGLHDAGYDIPVLTSPGNMTYTQMAAYAPFMPKELLFPGYRALTRNSVGPGPIRDIQSKYFAAFAAQGVKPTLPDLITWEPGLIVIDTLRHIGPNGTGAAAAAYINGLHGFAGLNGIYDFRDGSQRGIGMNAMVIDRWDPHSNDFVAVSKPGAYP
jgi:branched-chain amino acid transport system substrate-binding protein